ncbi:MAG: sigma factor [Anaerolineales bacterium]
MLQSGQAKEEMLAEALIEEYYAPVFRLALAVLDEPERARQAALETFGSALLEAHRYDGKSGVRAWLLRLALNTCQTYRGTKPTLKSELNPSLERGLPDSEILRSTLQRLGVHKCAGKIPNSVQLSEGPSSMKQFEMHIGERPGSVVSLT